MFTYKGPAKTTKEKKVSYLEGGFTIRGKRLKIYEVRSSGFKIDH